MKRLLHLFVAVAAVCSANAQGTTEAIVNYSPASGSSLVVGPLDGTVGWTFKPLMDLDVFALGCVQETLSSQSSLSIGLWTGAGQLVASNSVTSSSTLVNQSRYESITPIRLLGGQVYHIGAFSGSGTVNLINFIAPGGPDLNGVVTSSPQIQWLAAAQNTTGFGFPTAMSGGAGMILLGPNFQFIRPVPEPSTLALFGLGALALVCRRKNR